MFNSVLSIQHNWNDLIENPNVLKMELISEFKRFLSWESQSFDNWEDIDIYIDKTLSQAWARACPEAFSKLQDSDFINNIDYANGKWLEKSNKNDSYKIILSTKNHSSLQSLTRTLVHEIRHCLDYQNAVKGLKFEDYHQGNLYYNSWSEFRAEYSATRYDYFLKSFYILNNQQIFVVLAEILGRGTADAITGLIINSEDEAKILYYVSRYIGVSRSIRNINMEMELNAEVFHLWTMTPQYIIENYGVVFYLGNEWDNIEECQLDAAPKTYYYNDLI